MSVAAVIPAAGRGRRLGSIIPKAFVRVSGAPLFIHTLRALKRSYPFRETVLVVDPQFLPLTERILKRFGLAKVKTVAGGSTRAASVRNGLLALSSNIRMVAVHDAARPLITSAVVRRTVAAAASGGGAVCTVPVSSTVKRIGKNGVILKTEDRDQLVLAQTPQVFKKDALLGRYRILGAKAFLATDEAALFDGTGIRVRAVEGDERNVKITTKQDLQKLKKLLRNGG